MIDDLFRFISVCVYSKHFSPFALFPHRWSDRLFSGQRPPHDAPHLSSSIGAQRLRHQSGAHGRKTPDVFLFFLHLLLRLFLLPLLPQCNDPAQPLLLLLGDPVPLLTTEQLELLSSSQQLLDPKLPACPQVRLLL